MKYIYIYIYINIYIGGIFMNHNLSNLHVIFINIYKLFIRRYERKKVQR